MISPLSTRALYWRARYLRQTSLLRHLPFIFWLIETCRPTRYVELGVNEAVAYFAVCQVFDKLEPYVRCVGIGQWHDDGETLEAVRLRNNELYTDFSQLIEDDPRTAARRFRDGSVDLLLVDLNMDAELVDGLLHDWPAKLSERAIILLHGTEGPRFAEGPGQSLLSKLSERYPTVRFETGDGLVAVLWGEVRHESLIKLAELIPGDPDHVEVHSAFSRLGAAHYLEWSSRSEAERAQQLERQLGTLQVEKKTLSEELEKQIVSYDNRNRQVAGLQSSLFDSQTVVEAQSKELAQLRERLTSQENAAAAMQVQLGERDEEIIVLQDRLDARFRETTTLTRELQKVESATAALRAQLDARFREIATLTRELEKAGSANAVLKVRLEEREAALTKRLTQREKQNANLNRTLEEQRRQLDRLREYHEELTSSTSWRMTGPMRWIIARLRSKNG